MPASTTSPAPRRSGRGWTLVIAFLIVIGAGIGLAWVGAGSLRPDITASGLKFRTVKAGSGPTIMPQDAALLDYVGTLDDGTVFDSSETHGGPQPFTAGEVFPGFAEAMGRMQDGGEYRFTMPQSLAFAADSAPPGFPSNSSLTFDVRVRKVVRGGAAMMQRAPRQ